MRILIPWSAAFLFVFIYYWHIQLPRQISFVKGLQYVQEHKDFEAIQEFNKVIKVYPNYEPAYFNLADIYLHRGQLGLAKRNFRRARMISFINSDELQERGAIYFRKESEKDAVLFFNKSVVNGYFFFPHY